MRTNEMARKAHVQEVPRRRHVAMLALPFKVGTLLNVQGWITSGLTGFQADVVFLGLTPHSPERQAVCYALNGNAAKQFVLLSTITARGVVKAKEERYRPMLLARLVKRATERGLL